MSLLPGRIIPQDVPIGKVNEDGTVTIDKDWWLLLYNLCLQTLGANGQTLPIDDQTLLTEMDDAADDGNDIRSQVADLERLVLDLDEPQTTGTAADVAELQALSASFAEDPILARFTAQWDGLTPASGGGAVKFLRADGAWTVPPGASPPVGANPSASVGLGAVNGSAATFMTSDSAPPLSQAIVPTWTGLHTWSQNLGAFSATGNPFVKLVNTSATAQTPLDFFSNTGTLTGRIRNDFAGNLTYVSLLSGVHSFFVGGDSGVGLDSFDIKSGKINLANHTTTTTSTGGTASASGSTGTLGNPLGFVTIQIGGTDRKIPFYAT